MRKFKNLILALVLCFCIQTVFAEMKALTDKQMKNVSGQSGIIGSLIGFSEVFASTGGDKDDLKRAIPFNVAYVKQLADIPENVRNFNDVFQRLETRDIGDGWKYFEAEFDSQDEINIPGQQLTYTDAFSQPVEAGLEAGLGLFGLGGFKVEKTGSVHIKMSGKIKIEFRP